MSRCLRCGESLEFAGFDMVNKFEIVRRQRCDNCGWETIEITRWVGDSWQSA